VIKQSLRAEARVVVITEPVLPPPSTKEAP